MPTVRNLTQLTPGERIQDPLLVLEVEQRGNGDAPYTILILGNRTGRIATAPFWSEEAHRVAGIARGDVVQVIGEVTTYRDRRQLKVGSIRVLPRESVDWRELIPAVPDVSPYWERLDQWRREIRRPRLRATLDLFYEDAEFRRRYEECPASLAGHHAMLGGLLKHTWEVAHIGRTIAKVCRADVELVLAGALLHDLGKVEAYAWRGALEMTECGLLLGHVALGVIMLERRVKEQPTAPCTDQELMLLEHLILSHHGKLEFGAAVPPMTLEAEVLHYADNASAKTASMLEALTDPENFTGDSLFSRPMWQLDRRKAYRGTSDWGLPPAEEQAGPGGEG
ncbi:MAG TPA: HD domain-containing protein [Gemmatimonadales bacterium]|nr:HD domain-containing protein [Gemmatimonadales bacterium]